MTKPSILFVDDEQDVLDSLRLLLRPMRERWDMSFVAGGAAALALMDGQDFDVVLSDMRMPGIDGAQLLAEVAQRSPKTVRMVLSGYSDKETALRTVRLAHQFLTKPCPPEELTRAVEKALSLRGVINGDRLKRLIHRVDKLPALPPLYQRLMGELAKDNASLKHVGDIICRDTGMCSSMLRMVNSSFFGLPAHVSSVHHAVKLLGVETVRALVLSFELFSISADGPVVPGALLESLGAHSLRTACYCRAMAEAELSDATERDDSFIAGLLHDLGKLVLASTLGDEYTAVRATARREGRPLHEVESEAFGANHAEAGAYLLSIWGFKDAITEAVCAHHNSRRLSCAEFSPLVAVAVANHFDHELSPTLSGQESGGDGLPGISREDYAARLKQWRSLCQGARGEEE